MDCADDRVHFCEDDDGDEDENESGSYLNDCDDVAWKFRVKAFMSG